MNQIRTWVRQGRTDAWIAHQLEVTVQQIETFKRENELAPEDNGGEVAATPDFDDEIDLRAEDDALIAAELEAEQAEAAANPPDAEADADADADTEGEDDAEDSPARRRGRRGRGGGRGRRTGARDAGRALEGTFDHGEEGFGLWLDPAVEDNPVYAEHWAGHRPVEVVIEADRIVIRRAATNGDDVSAED